MWGGRELSAFYHVNQKRGQLAYGRQQNQTTLFAGTCRPPGYGLLRLLEGDVVFTPVPVLRSLTLPQAFAQQFCIDSLIH